MDPIHWTQANQQQGLFDPAPVPPVLPRWELLAPRIRQEVIPLLAEILVDYGMRMLEELAAAEEDSSE